MYSIPDDLAERDDRNGHKAAMPSHDRAAAELSELTRRTLVERVGVWREEAFPLFDSLVEAYGRSVLAWSGADVSVRDASRMRPELDELLRQTVEVAYLGAFAVMALDDHPVWREELARRRNDAARTSFVEEVRRVCPFVSRTNHDAVSDRYPEESVTIALLKATVQVFAGLSWELHVGDPATTPVR